MSKEAMKQALEALKGALDHGDFRNSVTDPTGTIDEGVVRAIDVIQPAIKALEEALAKQEQGEPVAWMFQHEDTGLTDCVDAQQVEWGFEKNNPRWQKIGPLYTTPQPSQKPLTDEQVWKIVEGSSVGYLEVRAIETAIEAAHGIK